MKSTSHHDATNWRVSVGQLWQRSRALGAILAVALLTVTGVFVANPNLDRPVFADPLPKLSGIVALDTNNSGSLDGSTEPGLGEPGFAGATVELICQTDNSVITTTTSAADGSWSMETLPSDGCDDDATTIPTDDGEVFIRVTTNNAVYVMSDKGGTPRVDGGTTVGQSAAFQYNLAAAHTIDSLVIPDFMLGIQSQGVADGSEPFDSGTNCGQPGYDCSASNGRVRSNDTVSYSWSVTATSRLSNATSTAQVVLEQTITLGADAVATFERIPLQCDGTNPASGLIAMPSGTSIAAGQVPPDGTTSVVFRCNLGTMAPGSAEIINPIVRTFGTSKNGSSYTSSTRTYAVDAAGVPTASPAGPIDNGEIDITAVPRYDIEKTIYFAPSIEQRDIGKGLEYGYRFVTYVMISTDRAVGLEPLQQPITVTDDMFAADSANDPLSGLRYGIYHCDDAGATHAGMVYGNYAEERAARSVLDSGTCVINRKTPSDQTSEYELIFKGIDMSGAHYPTERATGISLAAGPYYVASYQVQGFIPADEIKRAGGSLTLWNRIAGFDPVGVSGTSNYGTGFEPGYCDPAFAATSDDAGCNSIDAKPSNNVMGPAMMNEGAGEWRKSHLDDKAPSERRGLYPSQSGDHDGRITLEPGQIVGSSVGYGNNSYLTPEIELCDVYDKTMARLVPTSKVVSSGGADDEYAWLYIRGFGNGAGSQPADWVIEFAALPVTGDDPLKDGYSLAQGGRYIGDWSAQKDARCDDTFNGTRINWSTDATAIGLDNVNAVRVRPTKDGATGKPIVFPPAGYLALRFGVELRDTFKGGPYDGQEIPTGAVFANYGNRRENGVWADQGYWPSPETGNNTGDRVTFSEHFLAVQKRTISVDGVGAGAAAVGSTGAALAGDPIVWELLPAVTSVAENPASTTITVTDVLPEYVAYDPICTSDISGGTPPNAIAPDTPAAGQTTLTWTYDVTPNDTLTPLRICTQTSTLTPNNTSVVNQVTMGSDGTAQTATDTHTVVLEQSGSLKLFKQVDTPFDLAGDKHHYTLTVQNFSDNVTIEPVTIIDVLPYNGDAAAPGLNRPPGSSFDGTVTLSGVPTVVSPTDSSATVAGTMYYTADAPATVDQNHNTNSSIWCEQSSFGTAGCPGGFDDVTAIKFVGSEQLQSTAASNGVVGYQISFDVQAGNPTDLFAANANSPGDRYINRFSASSSTFKQDGLLQTLGSNRVQLEVVGFQVGDLIWFDTDKNGLYDAARDKTVPDGTTIELVDETSNNVVATTRTTGSTYSFVEVPQGSYYVRIAAAELADGGRLDGVTVSPAAASTDVEQNDDTSHDAFVADGVIRSTAFQLSATADGARLTGNEPLGDTSHGTAVGDDGFNNLSIDLALQPAPPVSTTSSTTTTSTVAATTSTTTTEPEVAVEPPTGGTTTTTKPIASPPAPSPSSPMPLPSTGTSIVMMLLLASGLTGGGLLLVRRRRPASAGE